MGGLQLQEKIKVIALKIDGQAGSLEHLNDGWVRQRLTVQTRLIFGIVYQDADSAL
jgi:hypothetical protein